MRDDHVGEGKTEERKSLLSRLRESGLNDMADEVVAYRRDQDRQKRSRRQKGKAARAARRRNRRG